MLPMPIDSEKLPAVPAIDVWFSDVYGELRDAAHRARFGKLGETLNTTLLVHELYLRMKKSAATEFAGKAQFFAYAGRALRSIMVDHARTRIAERERYACIAATSSEEADSAGLSPLQALALDAALKELELDDVRAAKVFEMHFFAGLTLVEIADHLELTGRTIDRDWRYARAFLQTALDGE